MKKLVILFSLLIFMFSFAGCGNDGEKEALSHVYYYYHSEAIGKLNIPMLFIIKMKKVDKDYKMTVGAFLGRKFIQESVPLVEKNKLPESMDKSIEFFNQDIPVIHVETETIKGTWDEKNTTLTLDNGNKLVFDLKQGTLTTKFKNKGDSLVFHIYDEKTANKIKKLSPSEDTDGTPFGNDSDVVDTDNDSSNISAVIITFEKEKDSLNQKIANIASRINAGEIKQGHGPQLMEEANSAREKAQSAYEELEHNTSIPSEQRAQLQNLFHLEVIRANSLRQAINATMNGQDPMPFYKVGTKNAYAYDDADEAYKKNYPH